MLRSRLRGASTGGAEGVADGDPRLAQLTRENTRLRELLAERAADGAVKSGYLCKYREHAEGSLFSRTWESRYFILKGSTLSYYRSEQDVQFHPRGQIELEGTSIEFEGLKRRKHYTWSIMDQAGVRLIRVSTEVAGDYQMWLDALEHAGCLRRDGDGNSASADRSCTRADSAVSDSDTTGSELRDGGSGGGQEADSAGAAATSGGGEDEVSPREDATAAAGADAGVALQRSKSRGYTSDQSDVAQGIPRSKAHHHRERVAMLPSTPVHTAPHYSLLSSERITFRNQRGLLTLVFIILAATNFRLILENMLKYGLRFNPLNFAQAAFTPSGNLPLLLCWPTLGVLALCGLAVEKLALGLLRAEQRASADNRKRGVAYSEAKRRQQQQALLSENLVLALNVLNTSAVLVVPSVVMHVTQSEPLPGFALTMVATVLWLKLVSYAHVNYDFRMARRKGEVRPGERGSDALPAGVESALRYPENVTFGNIAYFLVAPTLCYQLSYPRTRVIRVRWVLRRLVMLCGALGMMLFILEQYMEPTIDNSIRPLREMDWMRMLERVLKLSLPTLYFWLAMFYALFDLWLNIVAELTRFGDREFYKEWWNATTVGEYWRLWNMPVHKWMLRHVYFPCLRHRVPKFWAGILVFFVSAVFHEVLVGVPLHMLRMWSFWGIMFQVPLMAITEQLKRRLRSDRIGNIIFWVSFCFLGQPVAQIMYYHDWRKMHGLI